MSKRQNNTQPKMLPMVLQAIADLRESRGSTAKHIIGRIQDFLEKSNYNKTRNVVMQVKRAIKHAVEAGVVQQRSGRYSLTKIMPCSMRTSSKKPLQKHAKRTSDKAKFQVKERRKMQNKSQNKRRHSSYSSAPTDTSYTSTTRSYASSYSDATSYTSYHPKKTKPTLPKKGEKKAVLKKTKPPVEKQSKEREKEKDKQKLKQKQQPQNRPESDDGNDEEEEQTEDQDANGQEEQEEQQEVAATKRQNPRNDYDLMSQYIMEHHIGNECDNPDCLCNLKSEQMDELQAQYEEDMRRCDYLN